MKYLIVFLFSMTALSAQDFKTTTTTYVNGIPGQMNGLPGDVFTSTTKFVNLTSDSLHIAVSRYKNDLPPYWALCYCYIQCYSPADDNITVELAPYESVDVTLLFKTDSVNPGKAEAAFTIQQLGSSTVSHMTLTASTMPSTVGMNTNSWEIASVMVYPNPASDHIRLRLPKFTSGTAALYSYTGKLIRKNILLSAPEFRIDTSELSAGMYLLKTDVAGLESTVLFIKQ